MGDQVSLFAVLVLMQMILLITASQFIQLLFLWNDTSASLPKPDAYAASSAQAGAGENPLPVEDFLKRQVCRPFSHLIGQRSATCLGARG